MQASDGSSPGARTALLRLSMDLKLHPTIVIGALEYAFDNHPSFPSASQALCFGIVRQGHCVDMQILEAALQRLRRNLGGVFSVPAVQYVLMGPWFAQPVRDHRQLLGAASSPAVGSWPMPQQMRSSLLSKFPSSSGGAHDLSSMVEDTKFRKH